MSNSPTESFAEADLPSPTSQSISRGNSPTFEYPVTATMSGTTSTGPAAPKFGGSYAGVVWIGGPPKADWSGPSLSEMRTPMCIRGLDPINEMKGYSKRVLEGHSVKFKRDDESFGLPAFAIAAKMHMETYGLDTVFYMVGTDDSNKNPGIELFTYHRNYTREQVREFIEKQTRDNVFDGYTLTALRESSQWLVNSLDESLKASMRHALDTPMSGPEMWMVIVDEIMSDSLQRVDDLVKEFDALKLTKYKGENVAEYCEEAGNILIQLEKDAALPRMHLITILNVFCDCSVMDFKVVFMGRRAPIEKFLRESHGKDAAAVAAMSSKVTYKSLLAEGKSQYNNLKSRWGPAKAVKENRETALMAKLQAMEAKLNQAITLKNSGGGNNNNGNGNSGKQKVCYDCGSPDHFRGNPNCPKKKDSEGKGHSSDSDDYKKWPAPKDGDPQKKTLKGGKLIFWCAKCGRGKGRWNETHLTSGHQEGWLKQKKAEESKASASLASCPTIDPQIVPSVNSWFDE